MKSILILGCKYPALVEDGYCNDETNNIPCAFDGGDCCYSCVSKAFCRDCKCLTNYATKEINYPLIGDGYCHDEINKAACSYDGGDCCVSVNDRYCSNCTCHLEETCSMEYLLTSGDGICHDETNSEECNYDHGDCCLSNINTDHCSNCSCSVSGVITSPGFPHSYGPKLDLTWLIKISLGQNIEIVFLTFDFEPHHDSCGTLK